VAKGGSVVGTVRDAATGQGIANLCVVAARTDHLGSTLAVTDLQGRYTIPGLVGEYKVWFAYYATECTAGYSQQWWNDKPSEDLADPITLASGQTVSGIDASLEKTP
jgi:hypothetical protein